MRLYSYVVARDWGFAPNPFHGYCTLATCKRLIRETAQVDDWVIGTGSATEGRAGHLVYAMRVTETMSFDEYWASERFASKRPQLQGSRKQQYGDNIYRSNPDGGWFQADSHHSFPGGQPNEENLVDDTGAPRVLISDDFAYWGGEGPAMPDHLRSFEGGMDLCHGGQGHRCNFPEEQAAAFVEWFRAYGDSGAIAPPRKWSRHSQS
jgi:Nucleotide modification associated domain 2